MKRTIVGLILAILISTLYAVDLPQPKSFYDFEEGEGTTVNDLGTAANHGSFFGEEIEWVSEGIVNTVGDPNGCIEFLGDPFGVLSFVEIPFADYHNAPDYTFTAWVQWLGDGPNWGYVFWQNGPEWPEPELARHVDLWWHATGQNMATVLHDENNAPQTLAPTMDDTGIDIHDGDWHLVGLTLENNSLITLWTDGEPIAELVSEAPIITNGGDDLWLGARPNDAEMAGTVKMIGLMDRVRIWDTALTEEQMIALYDSEGPQGGTSAVEERVTSPTDFALKANYPNPFNPTTKISYSLTQTQEIKLEVCDLLGHRVITLFSGIQQSGEHFAKWYGTDESGNPVSSGVYIYRLRTTNGIQTRKMMLLR